MPTTVDSKVVEMRFDNAQFERNVRTSMSTIDKLKQKLNFADSAKSLEVLGASANKVNFSGMESGIDTVNVKFSHMSATIQHQLDRIVDKAVNTGTRLGKSLSVDQVSAGWGKYGEKTTSVATLVAQGNALEDVNEQLNRLNWFTDETSYNFTDMVANIAKFTATGKDLGDSVTAMEGIANWAALSGQNASTASRAMYQISQALGAGYFRLEDYKSIQNASMDTDEFRQKALNAAVALGTLQKNADGTYKSLVGGGDAFKKSQFTTSLTEGAWFTSDVMMKVFSDYSAAVDQIYEYTEEKGVTASQAIEALGDNVDSFGLKAFKAAQEARTWSDAVDSVKDAVSTGWMNTFELIFGDADQATELWTDLANVMYDIFASSGEVRNALLESALGKSFTALAEKVNGVIDPVKEVINNVKEVGTTAVKVADSLTDLGTVVDDVILGKFGNGKERFNKLTEAGYNWCQVQNEVNKKLGDSTRYTTEQIEAQEKLLKGTNKTVDATKKEITTNTKLGKTQKENLKSLAKLSDAELKQNGYTKEQISALKELTSVAEKLGIPFDEFIDQLDEINGRWILIDSFKNIGTSILNIFSAIKDGFDEIFEPITADSLFDTIAAFHKITEKIKPSEKQLKNLTKTFKGLFSILDLVSTIMGGGLRIGLKLFGAVLESVGMTVLDFTGYVGDMITKFNNWLQDSIIGKFIDNVIEKIPTAIDKVKEFLDSLNVDSKLSNGFKTLCDGIASAIDIIYGRISINFSSGIKILGSILKLFGTNLGEVAVKLADYIIQARDWIATNTHLIGGVDKIANILVALGNGIITLGEKFMSLKPVQKFITTLTSTIADFFKSFSVSIDGGFLDTILNGIQTAIEQISKWLDTLNDSERFGWDFVAGLVKGIESGIEYAVKSVLSLATSIATTFCKFFGIHSPSRKMFQYGMNIIQGLANGITAFFGIMDDSITTIGKYIMSLFQDVGITLTDSFKALIDSLIIIWDNLVKFLQSIDFKTILALIPVGVSILFAKKIYELINIFAGGIKGINSVISGFADIEDSISKTIGALGTKIKAEALMKIALSLGILVGAVIALAQVPLDKLAPAVGAIVILAGVLGALAFAINKLDTGAAGLDLQKKTLNISGLKTTLIQLGVAMLALSGAVKIMGSMKPEELTQGLMGLVGVMEGIALVVLSYAFLSSKIEGVGEIDKLGNLVLKLSIAMALMVGICKLVGMLTVDDLENGALFATGFGIFVLAMVGIYRLAGNSVNKFTGMILGVTIAMGLMIGICKLASMLSRDEMLKGGAFAVAFLAFIAILKMIVLTSPSSSIAKVSALVLSVTVAMGLMVGVCKLASMLTVGEMGKAALFVAGFLVFIGVLVAITKISSTEQIAKISGTLIAMSVAIGILAGVCVLMSLLSPEMLNKGLTAITVLGLIMAAMIAATRVANDVKGSILAMAAAIAVMAVALGVLSFIDTGKLITTAIALGGVMAAFAVMAKASSGLGGAQISLLVMTAMIGVMGGVIYGLAQLDIGSALGAVASISLLLLAMAGTMKILSTVRLISANSLVVMVALTAIAAALGGLLYLLRGLPVESSMATATALSTLILSLSAACILLEVAGLAGPAALFGVKALTTLITSVGALLLVIGGLATKFDQVGEFLDNGIPILEKIGWALGSFFGNIVGGFTNGVLSGLTGLAEVLTPFIVGIQGFIIGARTANNESLNGMINLAEMIAIITGASLLNGIASFITGGTNIASFKTTVLEFADAILELSEKLIGSNIDSDAIERLGKAGKSLAELEDALPKKGGIIGAIMGESELGEFGAQCVAFGEAIIGFSNAVSGKNIDFEAIEQVSKAGTLMAELEDAIPKKGGVLQNLLGESELGEFGAQCAAFGEAIIAFSNVVSNNPIDIEAVESAKNAGDIMAALEDNIPKKNGLISGLLGESDLETFGQQCVAFGKAMTDFSSNISVDATAVETAAVAGKMMTELDAAIPENGWLSKKADLSDFGKEIVAFGKYIVEYSDKVKDIDSEIVSTSITQANRLVTMAGNVTHIDTDKLDVFDVIVDIGKNMKDYADNVSGIDTSVTSVSISFCQRLRDFISSLSTIDTENIYNFKLTWISEALKTYYDNVSDINPLAVSESISAATQLRDFINSLSTMNGNGIAVFKQTLNDISSLNVEGAITNLAGSSTALTSTGVKMINGLVNGMNSQTHTIKGVVNSIIKLMTDMFAAKNALFKKLGSDLVGQLSLGIGSRKYTFDSGFTTILNGSSSTIRSYYREFYDDGAYISSGLASGIRSKLYLVRQASIELADAAESTTRSELKINSPSKVFRKLGSYLPEGFAQGISMYGSKIKDSIGNMSGTAVDGTKNAIAKIYDYVNSDLDSEPTIRPVMDLSDVESSMNSLDGLFSGTRSIGLTSNLGAINSIMNDKNQNGNNSEVVSAIDKLRKSMSGTGNTNYTINGVNYSGESDVANAIKIITRAAIMEGRV